MKALPRTYRGGADLIHNLIMTKSAHQGGAGRLLLLYHTHARFYIDPIAIEAVRRRLNVENPNFDAIYSLSPSPGGQAMVWDFGPGSRTRSMRKGVTPTSQQVTLNWLTLTS